MRSRCRRPASISAGVLILGSFVFALSSEAQTQPSIPNGFQFDTIATLTPGATGIEFLPDGRIILIKKSGSIWVLPVGANAVTQFYDVPEVAEEIEQGLVGLTIDPAWPARPYFYVNYSHTLAVSRVAMLTMTGDLADPTSTNLSVSSQYVLIEVPDSGPFHNGGDVTFGPDGMLYVPTGDDNTRCSVQDRTSLLGKILRLDISAMPGVGSGPPAKSEITPSSGNPFDSSTDPNEKLLYVVGVRNPYRIDIDTDGALFVADVGSDYYEEINLIPISAAGDNCGWPNYEGPDPHPEFFDVCPPGPPSAPPAFSYPNLGSACIIGGAVYRNVDQGSASFGIAYEGDYFAYDFLNLQMLRLQRDPGGLVLAPATSGQPTPEYWATDLGSASDFTVGPDGALYFVIYRYWQTQIGPGIYRINGPGNVTAGPVLLTHDLRDVRVLPNPSGATSGFSIQYTMAADAKVSLTVFTVNGRRVRQIHQNHAAGPGALLWDGRTENGRLAPAGTYYYRLETPGGDVVSGKLTLVH